MVWLIALATCVALVGPAAQRPRLDAGQREHVSATIASPAVLAPRARASHPRRRAGDGPGPALVPRRTPWLGPRAVVSRPTAFVFDLRLARVSAASSRGPPIG
jgi:hypothetical protein